MIINIDLHTDDVKKIISEHIQKLVGEDLHIEANNVKIEVKSKQNWKAEWEQAEFRVQYKSML